MDIDVKPSLTLRRRFAAPPAQVFSAWTEAKKLARWFCHVGSDLLLAESDARVGGRYRIVMRAPSGEEHDVSGTFREVVADRKLVFTWAWRSTPERQSLVSVEFAPDGEGTLLTLTHEQFFDDAARDRHRSGWQAILDRLSEMLRIRSEFETRAL
jgi:uncharacterized protein YndB with AHSA1/START domain